MRKPFLLNLLFIIAITFLVLNLNQIWGPSASPTLKLAEIQKGQKTKTQDKEAKKGNQKVASLSSYKVIGEKNLFRPTRKEWTAPPPPPKPKPKPKRPTPPPPPPPPPPDPLPEPELLGIVITKTDKVALMRGHKREEISSPAPRRPSRRRRTNYPVRKRYKITQEPMGRYHVGDTISEAKILKILKDKVVLERKGTVFQILLRDPTKKKKRSPSKSKSRRPRSRRR